MLFSSRTAYMQKAMAWLSELGRMECGRMKTTLVTVLNRLFRTSDLTPHCAIGPLSEWTVPLLLWTFPSTWFYGERN